MNSIKQDKKIKTNGTNQNGKKENAKRIESINGKEDISPTAKAALKAFALTYKNVHSGKSKRG